MSQRGRPSGRVVRRSWASRPALIKEDLPLPERPQGDEALAGEAVDQIFDQILLTEEAIGFVHAKRAETGERVAQIDREGCAHEPAPAATLAAQASMAAKSSGRVRGRLVKPIWSQLSFGGGGG